MNSNTSFHKFFRFFLTRIVIGIIVIAGLVFLIEWAGRGLLNKSNLSEEIKNGIISLTEAVVAVWVYIMLYRWYEKRKITELSSSAFISGAFIGFITGILLQSLFILIIYLGGGYHITGINPVKSMAPAFTTALTAGFVAEIILRGIIFRITEEKYGTVIALIISILIFAIVHGSSKGATVLSVTATTIEAGFLLSSSYVLFKSLWIPIFLHFAWDFAEPGIFGGINPGNNLDESLFTSNISESVIITGGHAGPQNSLQAVIICLITGVVFLLIARRKNNIIPFKPSLP